MPCDYKKYPPNWKEIRARILLRAGNCCEVCRVQNYKYVLRGTYNGIEAYQTIDGDIYSAIDGSLLMEATQFEGVECDEGRMATRIILTIAHLDHDNENWQVKDERLMAMCQKCHLGYDMRRNIQNRKAGVKRYKGLQEFEF